MAVSAHFPKQVSSEISPEDLPAERKNSVKATLPELAEGSAVHTGMFNANLHNRRYSEQTVRSYAGCLKTFLRNLAHKPIEQITRPKLIEFKNKYF